MLTIEQLIREGLFLAGKDQQHDLQLGFRCRLWSALDDTGKNSPGDGRKRRVRLATISIEKVLPTWESSFPNDRTPHKALTLAIEVIDGTTSEAVAELEMGNLWTRCDNLLWKNGTKQAAVMVGHGAIQVVREALAARHFGCEGLCDQSSDFDRTVR